MKIQKAENLNTVKKEGMALLSPATMRITVGAATCGLAKGARKLFDALQGEAKKQKISRILLSNIYKAPINSKSMTEKLLPLAAMERLLKKAGAERVSEDAKEALKQVLEDYAEKVGEQAAKFALHAGRKTVKASDVKLAAKTNK